MAQPGNPCYTFFMFTKILLAFSRHISKHEIHTFITDIQKEAGHSACVCTLSSPLELYTLDGNACIILTDQSAYFFVAQSRGIPGVFYLHEGNEATPLPSMSYAITTLGGLPLSYLKHVYERFFHLPWEILKTARCRIREMTVEDVDGLYEIYQDKRITRYMEDLYEDKAAEREYVREYISSIYGFYGFGMWLVERLDDHKLIGRAGLSIREGYEDPELGYVIRTDEQLKGYAFEVCSAIMDYAEKELEVSALNAMIHPDNTASIRLITKLGFHRIGKAAFTDGLDHYLWRPDDAEYFCE